MTDMYGDRILGAVRLLMLDAAKDLGQRKDFADMCHKQIKDIVFRARQMHFFAVDTDGKTPAEVAGEIIGALGLI